MEFKAGDLVYVADFTDGVSIETLHGSVDVRYPVGLPGRTYTTNGKRYSDAKIPNLYHATPENYKKLCDFFGEENVPKLPVRGSDLTKELLSKQKMQPCVVSDRSDDMARNGAIYCLIMSVDEYGEFIDEDGDGWKYAVPVDNNCNEITEL